MSSPRERAYLVDAAAFAAGDLTLPGLPGTLEAPMTDGPLGGRQCTARSKRSGQRCRRAPLTGSDVCWIHGAAAGQVQRAAARRVAEAEAVAAFERYRGPNGDSGTVNVIAELSRLVAAVTAFRDFTEARLRALTADEWAAHGPRVAAEVRMFETACDQARRVLRDVARLGLAERAQEAEARVSEAMGTRIAGAVAAIVVPLGHPSPLADRATGAICAEELEKLLGGRA